MLSKAKHIFNKTPKSFLNINSNFRFRNFSTKEVMTELNITKSQIKELNHIIKSPWVQPGKEKLVGSWFFLMAGIVLGILGFGGYVRLNKAGLSMVKWDLIRIQAPTTDEEWQKEFDVYKNHPQYKNDFPDMSLEQFKWIYNLEHWHRQLGKSLGIVFLVPFLFFASRGIIKKKLILSSLAIFSVGGIQATVGWWMVKSGLKENLGDQYEKKDVKVSPYRLATHFSFGLLIFYLLFKKGLFLFFKPQILKTSLIYGKSADNIRRNLILSLHALWLTIVYGSFMAGLDAGKITNTFPKMGDVWYPTRDHHDPRLITKKFNYNWTENPFIVHFSHRAIATGTIITTLGLFLSSTSKGIVHKAGIRAFALVMFCTSMQYLIGWFAVVNSVPKMTALLHQVWGVITVSTFILGIHFTRRFSKHEIKVVFDYLYKNHAKHFHQYLFKIELVQPKYYEKKLLPILKEINYKAPNEKELVEMMIERNLKK